MNLEANFFQEFYEEHRKVNEKLFGPNRSYKGALNHLGLEVQEALESGEQEEFIDCFFLILDAYRCRFPNHTAKDFQDAAWKKLHKNLKREWKPLNDQGFSEHIKTNE